MEKNKTFKLIEILDDVIAGKGVAYQESNPDVTIGLLVEFNKGNKIFSPYLYVNGKNIAAVTPMVWVPTIEDLVSKDWMLKKI